MSIYTALTQDPQHYIAGKSNRVPEDQLSPDLVPVV
jgi:hypothetical protein